MRINRTALIISAVLTLSSLVLLHNIVTQGVSSQALKKHGYGIVSKHIQAAGGFIPFLIDRSQLYFSSTPSTTLDHAPGLLRLGANNVPSPKWKATNPFAVKDVYFHRGSSDLIEVHMHSVPSSNAETVLKTALEKDFEVHRLVFVEPLIGAASAQLVGDGGVFLVRYVFSYNPGGLGGGVFFFRGGWGAETNPR